MVVKCCIKITDHNRLLTWGRKLQFISSIFTTFITDEEHCLAQALLGDNSCFGKHFLFFLFFFNFQLFLQFIDTMWTLRETQKNAACPVSVEPPTMWSFINILQSVSMTHCSAATGLKSRPCYDPAVIMSIHHQCNEYNRWVENVSHGKCKCKQSPPRQSRST